MSHTVEGTPIYASQALDSTYSLLLKDDSPAKKPVLATVPTARDNTDLRKRREALEPLIQQTAARHGLDPALMRAITHVESHFNTNALSPAGAAGLMQLMPATAKRYGVVNRNDAAQNLDAGARYMKDLLAQYAGNVALALAAYNAGERNVERHAKRVPPFRETMLYVPEVLGRYEVYRATDASAAVK